MFRILPCFFLVVLAGCYNHKFQSSTPPALVRDAQGGERHVQIGVIEFDDMGELFDRCGMSPQDQQPCQLTAVLNWITDRRTTALHETEPKNSVVVTFVHGWGNNAAPANDDLRQFSRELDMLQDRANDNVRYVGVYIGWRGSSAPGRQPWEYFYSVFNRESGARRVASVSATEVLFRIRDRAKSDLGIGKGRFVLVGHSFGGLIVERALAQALTALIVLGTENKPVSHACVDGEGGVEPFADLTVLINPAIDAIETQQLIDMLKRSEFTTCSTNPNYEPPLILSIKARTDSATGWIFTGAHILESPDKLFRHYGTSPALAATDDPKPPSQWSVYRHTAGALSYFQNYCFIDSTDSGDKACKKVASEVLASGGTAEKGLHRTPTQSGLQFPKVTASHYRQAFASSPSPSLIVPNLYTRYRGTCSYASCDVWNNTPYWIFTVPKDIVSGHGGWANPNFARLLAEIIEAGAVTRNPPRIGFKH